MSLPADEHVPDGEAKAIDRIVNVSLALLDTSTRPVLRGEHPKTVGCVRAEFEVEADIPENLRIGVFSEPRVFPALIRFSNGHRTDDRKKDIHGVAIKLMEVDGEKLLSDERDARTQDFLLADSPAFFVSGLKDYVLFSNALERTKNSIFGRLSFLLRLLFSPFRPWPLARRALSKKPDSFLRSWFWSQTPYALGPLQVKYALRPDLALAPKPPQSNSTDQLRAALKSQLSQAEAQYDFLIQTRTDPDSMPIEDASVEWDDAKAPFQKAASVRIPAQAFDFPEMFAFAENLSFTPWHARIEHRPLGGINRARRVVYDALSARRHECNEQPRREPEPDDAPKAP